MMRRRLAATMVILSAAAFVAAWPALWFHLWLGTALFFACVLFAAGCGIADEEHGPGRHVIARGTARVSPKPASSTDAAFAAIVAANPELANDLHALWRGGPAEEVTQ